MYNILHVISVPLLNMRSAAPLSVVLSLLSQMKEGKRGRSVIKRGTKFICRNDSMILTFHVPPLEGRDYVISI